MAGRRWSARAAGGRGARSPLVVGLALCLLVAVVVAGGLVHEALKPSPWYRFRLDGEYGVAAVVTTLLLLGAAATTARAAARGGLPRAGHGVAALLGFMAADEMFMVHERVQLVFGVRWEVLYSPLLLGGAVCALLCLLAVQEDRSAVALLLVGGTCWAVAQVLEDVQWVGPVEAAVHHRLYLPLMVAEETLEMLGTVALLVLGLRRDRAWASPTPAGTSSREAVLHR